MLSHRPVSLVMPTIGRMDFVDEAIASALNQSLPFDELLVFDNSRRQNLSELSGFGDDERVTWVRSGSFLGPIDSWNTAVGRARNDYVAILGDDDIALPNFHEEIQALLRRSDLGLVRMKWIDERGQEVHERAGIHQDLSPTEFRHQRIKQAIRSYLPGVVLTSRSFIRLVDSLMLTFPTISSLTTCCGSSFRYLKALWQWEARSVGAIDEVFRA